VVLGLRWIPGGWIPGGVKIGYGAMGGSLSDGRGRDAIRSWLGAGETNRTKQGQGHDDDSFQLIGCRRQGRSRRTMKILISLFAMIVALVAPLAAEPETGFVSLFDGNSLDGWKVNEAPEAFSIEDGAIKANGNRCHLFYEGKVNGAKFTDFELRLDVMTRKNSNGGLFIHTEFQKNGWPRGYEIQVNNTQSDPQKSGGLYNTVKNLEPFADDTWMKYVITVKGDLVIVKVNDKELVNYKTESATTKLKPEGGTIAIQAHDKGSTTLYKNIRIQVLK
jgi:Domain of Unknown Function (DUF1080)